MAATMVRKPFGWTGVEVPVIGQGTWMIEGSHDAERRAVAALQLGLDLGMTHIDTAEMYGNGGPRNWWAKRSRAAARRSSW